MPRLAAGALWQTDGRVFQPTFWASFQGLGIGGLLGRRAHAAALHHLGGDLAEIGIGVGEETLHAGAEIVVSGLAVGGFEEAVLRALAVAGEEVGAALAVVGERVVLVAAELAAAGPNRRRRPSWQPSSRRLPSRYSG